MEPIHIDTEGCTGAHEGWPSIFFSAMGAHIHARDCFLQSSFFFATDCDLASNHRVCEIEASCPKLLGFFGDFLELISKMDQEFADQILVLQQNNSIVAILSSSSLHTLRVDD